MGLIILHWPGVCVGQGVLAVQYENQNVLCSTTLDPVFMETITLEPK